MWFHSPRTVSIVLSFRVLHACSLSGSHKSTELYLGMTVIFWFAIKYLKDQTSIWNCSNHLWARHVKTTWVLLISFILNFLLLCSPSELKDAKVYCRDDTNTQRHTIFGETSRTILWTVREPGRYLLSSYQVFCGPVEFFMTLCDIWIIFSCWIYIVILLSAPISYYFHCLTMYGYSYFPKNKWFILLVMSMNMENQHF